MSGPSREGRDGMFGPMGGGINDMKGPTQEQDEEDEEWARSIKRKE